ncbi:hypothetical protein ACN27F_11025 [Solwaraspora sp. WMMB335]|uniref:hypothetical protein n=1 Tax=Solwaraspora sp. WMMB335 TaxID=3404118 RepID=UPI003B93346E
MQSATASNVPLPAGRVPTSRQRGSRTRRQPGGRAAASPAGGSAADPGGVPAMDPAQSPDLRPTGRSWPADEPVAVVIAGSDRDSRGAVLSALLGDAVPPVDRPSPSYLTVRYGSRTWIGAYLPGWPEPWPIPVRTARSDPATSLPRPPRRIEMTRPDRLLRHFTLVDTPDTGARTDSRRAVLVDAARRGGALLFVIGAGPPPQQPEYDLLRQTVAAGAAVFLAVTPAAAISATVPDFAGASWLAVDPAAGDVAHLRRTLIDWADRETLHRTGGALADREAARRRTPATRPDATGGADWPHQLDRSVRRAGQRVRQELAIDLANIHLAGVQEVLFGGGPAATAGFLDGELLALATKTAASIAAAVDGIIDQMCGLLPGVRPGPENRRRVGESLRGRMLSDLSPGPMAAGLLCSASGEVRSVSVGVPSDHRVSVGVPSDHRVSVGVPSDQPADVFAGYSMPGSWSVLPPIGLALAADCWHPATGPSGMAPEQARWWTQQVVRALEIALSREVTQRFDALLRGLARLLADAIDLGELPR